MKRAVRKTKGNRLEVSVDEAENRIRAKEKSFTNFAHERKTNLLVCQRVALKRSAINLAYLFKFVILAHVWQLAAFLRTLIRFVDLKGSH